MQELWRHRVPTSLSRVIVAGDNSLFVGGDDGLLRAIDARSGAHRWQRNVGSAAGTPRFRDGLLYIPTAGGITALDVTTNEHVWRITDPARVGLVIAPHGVYYVSKGDPPILVSLRLDNGEERWRAELGQPWTPTLFAANDHILVSTGTHERVPWLFSADSGEYLLPFRPEPGGSDMGDERFILHDHVISVDPMFGEVHAAKIDGGTYSRVWQRSIDAVGGFAIAGGRDRVFFGAHRGSEAGLYALELATGEIEWQLQEQIEVVGRPTVGTEALLVRTADSLRAYNPSTGAERWRRSPEGIGSHFVLVDDLLFTARNSVVRAFRPTET